MIQNYNYFQSAREAPPAEGRPAGLRPPGTIIQNHNYIITTVFYNLKNLNNIINIISFFILIRNLFKGGL